jgi:hypothetical protein
MGTYDLNHPAQPQPDKREDQVPLIDDDPELQPYLEAFDRLIEEPPQYPEHYVNPWRGRLWSAALAERNHR